MHFINTYIYIYTVHSINEYTPSKTLYLDDMLCFFGDIMFQQAGLINHQRRMSKLFWKIRFSYQSDQMLSCKNEDTLLKI